jgi:hypothetical protein
MKYRTSDSHKMLQNQVQSLLGAFQKMTDQDKLNNAAQYLFNGGILKLSSNPRPQKDETT